MPTMTQDEKLIKSLERISDMLTQSKKLISSELVVDFQSKANSVKQNLMNIKQTERVMRIGIVGEVKAGKSSFLNSLIFEGESILPKAPTPMTAALTKLGYSDQPSAKIVFYTNYDWQGIERLAEEYRAQIQEKLDIELQNYDRALEYNVPRPTFKSVEAKYKEQIPTHLTACHELIQLAKDSEIDIWDYLGQTKEIKGGSSIENFMQELNNYVGTNGQFTHIVKHTEILINNPLLQDIEIIDTPGLNDPILSRSEKTKEFLMNCDVVFLLSYAGQFLGNEDIQFITTTLPNEGIRKAILVGSKFDSGILDYNKRKASFKEAFQMSRKNFDEQAASNIRDCLKSENSSAVLKSIADSLPPKYVSSLMYAAAKRIQQNAPLTEEEENVIKRMTQRFEGFTPTADFLFDLSNIKNVREKTLAELKNEKEQTIAERIAEVTNSQKNKFLSMLENINIVARHNQTDLNQYDFDQLEAKLKNLRQKLNSIRSEVKSIFEFSSIEAKRILKDLEIDIAKEIDNYLGLTVAVRTETHERSRKAGFLGLRTDFYTVTETINTANVQEATASLRKYTTRTKELVNKEFRTLFNINDLKKQLKNAVIGAFDLSDATFNENDILLPMEIILGKLTIPSIDIDVKGYDEEIIRKFSTGVIEGNAISELLYEQERLLRAISKNMEKTLQLSADRVEQILLEQASVFVDNVEQQLMKNVEIIQNLLKDKEQSIWDYEQFIEKIMQFKTEIRDI